MASLQLVSLSLGPLGRGRIGYQNHRSSKIFFCRGLGIYCKIKDDDDSQSKGEEPTESLFMRELKRRGMNENKLLEESNPKKYVDEEMKIKEEGEYSKRNTVSTDYEKSLTNQRERSMALNSEGLEGLIPRAKLLVSTGATFFLGFGPLILITIVSFSALCLYFGPAFVHDASRTPISPPSYVDPYTLLQDERISQMAPRVK